MDALRNAPDPALEVIAEAGDERWTVIRPGMLGLFLAFLDVATEDPAERYSFSVTGWTHEEIGQRIDRVRRSAALQLSRRRQPPDETAPSDPERS